MSEAWTKRLMAGVVDAAAEGLVTAFIAEKCLNLRFAPSGLPFLRVHPRSAVVRSPIMMSIFDEWLRMAGTLRRRDAGASF